MKAGTKKIIFFIGAMLVAILFITSYAAFNNNNVAGASTSIVKTTAQPTVFATGYANALITGYAQISYVRVPGGSNSLINSLGSLMSKLEANGSIDNYVYPATNNSYEVYSSELSAFALKSLLAAKLNASNSIVVGSTAYVTLPSNLSMYYSNSSPPISVPFSNRNYTLYLNNVRSVGSPVNVSVSALLTQRGMPYNNQVRISLR